LGIAALGSAVVAGAALDALRRVEAVVGWRRIVGGAGSVAAVIVVASAALLALPGRAGLPGDELTNRIGFTGLGSGDPAASRILVVGPEDTMPGESRSIMGAAYRVVDAPLPDMTEAWLPAPAAADAALEAELDALIAGETFRAGEALEPYGIRWIISLGPTPLEDVFAGQLDLIPLGATDGVALTPDERTPVRAAALDGDPTWARVAGGYEGARTEERVVLAENASPRWEPDSAPMDDRGWGVDVAGGEGRAWFRPIATRRLQAIIVGAGFLVLLGLSAWGRRPA
jgi:hypothetical protein